MEQITSKIHGKDQPAVKAQRRLRDGQQIDIGFYEVMQGEYVVGKVFVEQIATGHTKEHWLLYSSYTWPSSTNDDVTLRIVHVSSTQGVEDLLRDPPSGATYIVADCETQQL